MNHRLLFLYVGFVVLSVPLGCESEPELFLTYPGDGSDGWETPTQDSCWLTGPDETVFLAELLSEPIWTGIDADCTVEDPYFQSYFRLRLKPVRTVGPEKVAGDLTAVAPQSWNAETLADSNLSAGDEVLVSVREARGTAFAIRTLPVVSTSSQPSTSASLPSKWSELGSEVQDTQASFDPKCTGRLATHPNPGGTPLGTRLMTDDEFEAFVHTPAEKSCIPPEGPEPTPAPGVIEVD